MGGAVSNAVEDLGSGLSGAVSSVGDIGQGAINAVSDLGVQIDQGVRNTIPGGWTTAALLAAGYYYYPEISAYMDTLGDKVPLSEVVDASNVPPAPAPAPTPTPTLPPTEYTGPGFGEGVSGSGISNPVYDITPPPTSIADTLANYGSQALDYATANPVTTALGINALTAAAAPAAQPAANTASTPQPDTMNLYNFNRTYNTPSDILGKQYVQGQNTNERDWMNEQLTKGPTITVPTKAAAGGLMNLHDNAQHLADQGRGPDTMLMHVAPDEVAKLQNVAKAQGGSLSINPHTGLPEANFLSDLNPLNPNSGISKSGVAPLVMGALLGPAGLEMSAANAGLVYGGISALSSGSLQQGLMAGLGAYGGAGLAQGLMNYGTSQIAGNALSLNPEATAGDISAARETAQNASTLDKLKTGLGSAVDSPKAALEALGNGSAWKGAGTLAAATSPILANQMVKTTTPPPSATNPALIRPYTFQRQPNVPQNMIQGSYQPGQVNYERNWFDNTLTPYPSYPASQAAPPRTMAAGGMASGGLGALGGYSVGGQLLRGPGDGVSDSIPAQIGNRQPARLADGEFVVPARIVSELGNGSTEAGAKQLYKMMDRVQNARGKTTGKEKVAKNTNAAKYLPA